MRRACTGRSPPTLWRYSAAKCATDIRADLLKRGSGLGLRLAPGAQLSDGRYVHSGRACSSNRPYPLPHLRACGNQRCRVCFRRVQDPGQSFSPPVDGLRDAGREGVCGLGIESISQGCRSLQQDSVLPIATVAHVVKENEASARSRACGWRGTTDVGALPSL